MISSHGRIASFIIVVLSFGFLLSLTGASAFDVGALNVSNESNDTNTTTPVVDTTIGWRAESVDGYAQHSNNTQYNFSVKQGSNWGDGTRYCVGSNCLIYQPSDMSYRNSVGSQDYLSNILAVNVVVENDTATYPLAFPNTDVTYTLGSSQVKELFVLQSLPRVPAGWLGSTENVSLDFGGYIKYGSLSLRVNGEAMPLEFTTNQRIDFVDENGTTVFYLPAPVAYDSDGDTVSIEYEVEDRSGEVWFYVRTPYSWLANASRSYPVMIDPTVSVPTFEGSTGLVAYYNFENEDTIGTTLYDAWGTRNPTLYNTPTTNVTGVLGEAYSFTPNDYLEGPRIDLSGGLLTISAWVYHDALSTTNPLFSQRDNPSNNDFQISSSTDRTEASWLIWGSNPNTYTSGTGFFTSGGWNHYVFTYNGSHGRFYRNGTFFGEDVHVNTISNDAATEFRIGNDHYTNYFGGDIDEVAIYNTILSDEEISALYNDGAGARPFSLKTNLESYYTFDNATTSGTTLYDHWRSTDATLVNTPTTGASGIIGDAYDFDRASLEYLQTSRTLTDTSYTVSAWARPTTVGVANDIHVIWSTEDVTEGAGYSLEFYNNAGTYVIGHFTHDGGTSSQFLSGGSYTANEWYHVVVTVDGTTRKLYVDGVLLTNDVLGGVTEHSVQPVRIGQMGNDPVATYPRYFPGKLDELLYYTRAISGQEVADLYADQSNDTRPWSGYEFLANDAVAAWTLDDAQTNGTTHSDLAGTRDLTIDGATSASTGIVGEAFNFDGTNDRAYVVDDFTDVFENQDHTMSVWVKADTLTGGHTVWDSSDGDTVGEWNRLAWDTASNWWQAAWDDGTTVRFIRDARTANTSQWYHIVTVHTEGTVGYELFIDGVSYGTSSGHGGSAETASTLTLGWYPGDSSYWDGVIDEFYIYDRALNDYQVEQLYAAASVDGEQYPFTATASAPVIDYTNLTAVNVSVNDSSPIEGDVISYTTTITPDNATNVTYFVDFGDGTNSTSANGTHTYTTAGSYNLSVNATDSQNNVFTSTAPITVLPAPEIGPLEISSVSAGGVYYDGFVSNSFIYRAPITNFQNPTCQGTVDGGSTWSAIDPSQVNDTYAYRGLSIGTEGASVNISIRCQEDDRAFLTSTFINVTRDQVAPTVTFNPTSSTSTAAFNVSINVTDAGSGVNESTVEYCASTSGACTPNTTTPRTYDGYTLTSLTYLDRSAILASNELVGLFLTSDGEKMYVTSRNTDVLYRYDLTTPNDVTGVTLHSSIDITPYTTDNPQSVALSPDGTNLYLVGYSPAIVVRLSLSTPWDLNTASYVENLSVSEDGVPTGVAFSPDGTTMMLVGQINDRIYEYALSTPWDLSTATYERFLAIGAQESNPKAIDFNSDGSKVYIVGTAQERLTEYDLPTPYDLTSASLSATQSFARSLGEGMTFSSAGEYVYTSGGAGDETSRILRFNLTNTAPSYYAPITEYGTYTLCVGADDNVANTDTTCSSVGAYVLQVPVTVENVNLTPSLDFNLFSPYVINANVTNGSALNNVTVTYVSNSTFESETCFNYYVNGTCDEQLYEDLNMTFNGTNSLWEYTVYPDSIYPEIYYVPSAIAYLTVPANYSVSANDYHLFNFTNPYEFTNRTSFFIELNVAPKSTSNSVPLDVYIIDNGVNASFFEGDWMSDARAVLVASANPDADLVESISRDTPVHHTHSDTSSHQLIRLSTDENKTIGGVNVSGQFLVAIIADNPSDARGWWLRYQEACTTDRWLVADSTPTFQTPTSVASGCPDVHVHVVRDGETNADYLNATVTANYDGGSATNNTVFYYSELLNLPPNPSSFITPPSDGYVSRLLNSTYKVQWNEATDPNNDPITYTVFLLNSNLSQNATLVSDTSSLSYDWAIPASLSDGEYYFVLEACDDTGECTNNSEPVTFDSTAPVLSDANLPSVSADDTGVFSVEVEELNQGSTTLTFTDPNNNEIGPLTLEAGSGNLYFTTYRFVVVGDYKNATFTSTDAAGNTASVDAGSFFVSNPPPTSGGGGGGGGLVGDSTSGTTEEPKTATIRSSPELLRLSAFRSGGELVITNFETQQETFSIFIVESEMQEYVSFNGQPSGLVSVQGVSTSNDNKMSVSYDVARAELSNGEYSVTFLLVDSNGNIADFTTATIVEETTVMDNVFVQLDKPFTPVLELGFVTVPSLNYFTLIAISASVLVAGLFVRSSTVARRKPKRTKEEEEEV